MKTDLIVVSEYCVKSNTEPGVIRLLEEEGLITITWKEGRSYLLADELNDLERYVRLYNELSINPQGIDAIHHLLRRMRILRRELSDLRKNSTFTKKGIGSRNKILRDEGPGLICLIPPGLKSQKCIILYLPNLAKPDL